MLKDLLRERSPSLRVTVELPESDRPDANQLEVLVRVPNEGNSAADAHVDGDGESRWEDAAWQ